MEEILEFYIFEITSKLARVATSISKLTLNFDSKAYVEAVMELKGVQGELEGTRLNFSEKGKLVETVKLLKEALVRTTEQIKIPRSIIMKGEETY